MTRSLRAPAIVLTTLAIILTLASVAGQVTPDGRGDEGSAVWLALSLARDGDRMVAESDRARARQLTTSAPADAVESLLPAPAPARTQIYALAAAPLARALGVNGLLLLNILLLVGVMAAGSAYLAAGGEPGAALGFTLAFIAGSAIPAHVAWLGASWFNGALVFLAWFLAVYREVAPPVLPHRPGLLKGTGALGVSALLLGLVAGPEPVLAPLVVPLLILVWSREGRTTALATLALFAAGMLTAAWWSGPQLAVPAGAGTGGQIPATSFLVGRHVGLVPFFFPVLVSLGLWLAAAWRAQSWQWTLVGAAVVIAVTSVWMAPYGWAGEGAGPLGNRAFLPVTLALFFLTPAVTSWRPAAVAFLGGATFVAPMLLSPAGAARVPWVVAQQGLLRALPVEVSLSRNLPAAFELDPPRVYDLGGVRVMALDDNSWPPEPDRIWVRGGDRADFVVETDAPVQTLSLLLHALGRSRVTVSTVAARATVEVEAGTGRTVQLPVRVTRTARGYASTVRVASSGGAVPAIVVPGGSRDRRYLGVQVQFAPTTVAPAGQGQ